MSNQSTVITPARPAKADETAKAPAFARATPTPIAVAAASLSRTARHDRPTLPRTAPLASRKAIAVRIRKRYQIRSACRIGTPSTSISGPPLENGKPNSSKVAGVRPVDVPPVRESRDCPK